MWPCATSPKPRGSASPSSTGSIPTRWRWWQPSWPRSMPRFWPARRPRSDPEETARDRLFDAMMRRYDALETLPRGPGRHPSRRHARSHAGAGDRSRRLRRSMAAMLEAASVPSEGLAGALRQNGLLAIHYAVSRVYDKDETTDLSEDHGRLGQPPEKRPSAGPNSLKKYVKSPEAPKPTRRGEFARCVNFLCSAQKVLLTWCTASIKLSRRCAPQQSGSAPTFHASRLPAGESHVRQRYLQEPLHRLRLHQVRRRVQAADHERRDLRRDRAQELRRDDLGQHRRRRDDEDHRASARATWSAPRWKTSPSTAAKCSPPRRSRRRRSSRSTSPRRATRRRSPTPRRSRISSARARPMLSQALSARVAELTEEVKAAIAKK